MGHRSSDATHGQTTCPHVGPGPSKKKENVDAGIAPWLAADFGDYKVSTSTTSPSTAQAVDRTIARRAHRELELRREPPPLALSRDSR